MLPLTSGSGQRDLFLIRESTVLTSKCNAAPEAAVISVIMAENGMEGNQINRGMMDRWREVSKVCLRPLSLPHKRLSPQLHLAQLSYLDVKTLRTGQRWLWKCCTFARRAHASTCKWADALAFDILRATQSVQCERCGGVRELAVNGIAATWWSALSGHL